MGGVILAFVIKPGSKQRPNQLVRLHPDSIWESAIEYRWSFPIWDRPAAKSRAMSQYPRGQPEFNRLHNDSMSGYEEEGETLVDSCQALRLDTLDSRVRTAFKAVDSWYFIGYDDPASGLGEGTLTKEGKSDPAIRERVLDARLQFLEATPDAVIEAYAYD